MKKIGLIAVSVMLLLSSCGSYMATGAYTGSSLGSVLGSAIGGLSGGGRGSDLGSIIGMAGGAVIGGAIGNAADKSRENRIAGYHEKVMQRESQRAAEEAYERQPVGTYDSQNSGDDRIEFRAGGSSQPGGLVISNVQYEDADQVLRAGEVSKIMFELRNTSNATLYDVQPQVQETTGNRHILVSPGISVESIAPGSGIRYTATVVGDRSLKNGQAVFELSATSKSGVSASVESVTVETSKR